MNKLLSKIYTTISIRTFWIIDRLYDYRICGQSLTAVHRDDRSKSDASHHIHLLGGSAERASAAGSPGVDNAVPGDFGQVVWIENR